jgi:hypothetical protein
MSPGDAFSSSLEQSLLLRANQQRQAQQDQLAMQREARQQKHEEDERAQAAEALAENRQKFALEHKEKRKAAFEKAVGTMLPGDIPDPDMVAQSKEFGMGHLFPDAQPKVPESMPGIAAVPQGQVQQGVEPTRTGQVSSPETQQAGVRFLGLPQQRMEQQNRDAALSTIAKMAPDDPRRAALQSAIEAGVEPSAKMFEPPPAEKTQTVARVSNNRKVVEVYRDGNWVKADGNTLPKDTHFIQEPAPASTFSNDLRTDAARTHAYDRANTELNKTAAPFEDQMKNLQAAEEVLNERSPSGDAHVAPMLLKALVAGQGSGFRMTKAEIDQVQNARTKWQSMEAAMRKYSANPGDALFFDDAQRKDFLHLVQTMRKATERHLEPMEKARRDIDSLDSPRDIQKRVSDMHHERAQPTTKDDSADAGPVKPKLSGKAYLDQYRSNK